ncbi:hypothetical protein ES703_41072 [subsurface metagenome]
MKADLYVQGNFWATIIIPGDSLLALLAKGMIAEANLKAQQLARELNDLDQVQCSVSLRFSDPVTYSHPESDQDPHEVGP